MISITRLALVILVAEAAVSAQFQCGLQLKDGDSITISQQYVATQSRCTINGPAVGTATITSLVTDTQAIVLDDDSGGEIVLSGNINFASHVTSVGYSALCDPSAFIATNGNVTISAGGSIKFHNSVRNPGPVICAQNAFIMGDLDVSDTPFNGQVISCQHGLIVGASSSIKINDVMGGSALVASRSAVIQGKISAKTLYGSSDGGLIRSSHVDIQESAVITVYNASVSNSGGLFTGDSVTISGTIIADMLHSDNAAGLASSDNIELTRTGTITATNIDCGDGGGVFAGGMCIIDGSISATDINLGAQGGIASCNNISITGHINASRISAAIGGAVLAAAQLSVSEPAVIISSDTSTPNIGGFAWVQGDVHISGHVIIDASDCKAAKFAGAIWADGKIEMTGAYDVKFQQLQSTGSCGIHSGTDISLASSGTLLIQDCFTLNSTKYADVSPGVSIDGTPQPLSRCNSCMRSHAQGCGCPTTPVSKLPPFTECCS